MNFKLEKRGHIFKPDNSVDWMKSHAQGSSGIVIDNKIRVFFASRPSKNITLPTFIDLDISNPSKIIQLHTKPILELGEPGSFDEFGIIPVSPILINNTVFLYYIGWSRRTNTPYSLSIGLATSKDGTNFTKYSKGPVLGIEKDDWLSVTAPCVIFHNNIYYMFYTAGLKWHLINERWEHTYTVRLATSEDGIRWLRDFKNILIPRDEFECLSSPTILNIDDEFHMWYSYKGSFNFRNGQDSYRIGYATSKDLLTWVRKDEYAGIDISEKSSDWDSEMIEYPCSLQTKNKNYIFYNGNGFGESGFGYAEIVKY